MKKRIESNEGQRKLSKYLFPVNVWALSFGCAVGWGSFVMPGTTFLPKAGPLGTAIGIGIGAVVMFIIGLCYYYLMKHFPDAGGTFSFVSKTLGHDYGFLTAWFLILVYVAVIWANATAIVLIARTLFGELFQFGFHYQILGYDVYFGEILLTIIAILLAAVFCVWGKAFAGWLQTILAVLLIGGILICFLGVILKARGAEYLFVPRFAPSDEPPALQIFSIVILSPWAFVGFESISHSAEEFRFPIKKVLGILIAALAAGAVSYIMLSLMAGSVQPSAYRAWPDYIRALPGLSGVEGLPTFFAVKESMGGAGVIALGVAMLAGILTGLIGNFIAASRLLYAMSESRILPKWFSGLNKKGVPQNAFLFLTLISLIIPFLGRTAIGGIVDVTTLGATIAYGCVSAAAIALARQEKKKSMVAAGILGVILSLTFFVYFMALSRGALSTESYLILAAWAIIGFIYFRYLFGKNRDRMLGKSVVVWVGLLFLILVTTLLWVRQDTEDLAENVVINVSDYYEQMNPPADFNTRKQTEHYLSYQMSEADKRLVLDGAIQMSLIIASLLIMLSIYSIMNRREKEAEAKKVRAEESSVAKSAFLSNMSHDIRTPMNAIIGYIHLAERDQEDPEKVKEYLSKIKTSSNHLLALINDVLEMSRIESGRMDLEPVPVNLRRVFEEIRDIFATQMREKEIAFQMDASEPKNPNVLCDRNRLNRVLMNLISNAYKFTPEGGSISVTATQLEGDGETGIYEIRVKDTGIGMTPEFAEKVFDAFERERDSTVSGIQGTGLGMSITKSIVELMGGTISVQSEKGKGTEFLITLTLPFVEEAKGEEKRKETVPEVGEADYSKMRLLLVEDMEINREIAMMMLGGLGFRIETAVNGKEAVEKIEASEPGYFDAVLMDIQMPVMNGYEATRAIRALPDPLRSDVPILAMTANAFAEDVKKAKEAGMDGHVAKPIDLNAILKALGEVILQKKEENSNAI